MAPHPEKRFTAKRFCPNAVISTVSVAGLSAFTDPPVAGYAISAVKRHAPAPAEMFTQYKSNVAVTQSDGT
jgi:hypothetical protein